MTNNQQRSNVAHNTQEALNELSKLVAHMQAHVTPHTSDGALKEMDKTCKRIIDQAGTISLGLRILTRK
jgi:hypothetical protein